MRADNRRVKNTVVTIYLIVIVLGVLVISLSKSLGIFADSTFIVVLALFVLLVSFHSVAGYFEYDSDGPMITILNRGLVLTEFINYRERKLEFSRQQLIGFKIKNYILYKSLVVLVKTKEGKQIKKRFNISLLKTRKMKYVKQSLKKILKANSKRKQ